MVLFHSNYQNLINNHKDWYLYHIHKKLYYFKYHMLCRPERSNLGHLKQILPPFPK